jgi:hypothetical protein
VSSPTAQPIKDVVTLVEFTWGNPVKFHRLTDSNEEVDFVSVFAPEPFIEIQYPVSDSGLEETPLKVITKIDEFTHPLSFGEAHAPVNVVITELVRDADGVVEANARFSGKVVTSFRNYRGDPNRVLITCEGLKNELDIPLGIVGTHQCPWKFGGRGCLKNLAPLTNSIVVETIERDTIITATNPVFNGSSESFQTEYNKGTFSFDGLALTIRAWDKGSPRIFYMTEPAPSLWTGVTATLVSGCDLSIESCRRWGNESQFGAIGYGTPAYYPLIENEGSPDATL